MTAALLSEKEIEILTAISNLRFLTTNQIYALYGYGGKYGLNVTRRKLLELENKKLLNSWQPSKFHPKIYYVTKNGAQEVEAYNGYEGVKLCRKSDHTLHHVLVSEVYVSLRLSKAGKLRRFALETPVGEGYADAFVQYDIGGRSKVFFLEADRGTENIAHIRDIKLDHYERAHLAGKWQRQFGIFPDVVFVTVSEVRKRSLIWLGERFSYKVRVLTLDEFAADGVSELFRFYLYLSSTVSDVGITEYDDKKKDRWASKPSGLF